MHETEAKKEESSKQASKNLRCLLSLTFYLFANFAGSHFIVHGFPVVAASPLNEFRRKLRITRDAPAVSKCAGYPTKKISLAQGWSYV